MRSMNDRYIPLWSFLFISYPIAVNVPDVYSTDNCTGDCDVTCCIPLLTDLPFNCK